MKIIITCVLLAAVTGFAQERRTPASAVVNVRSDRDCLTNGTPGCLVAAEVATRATIEDNNLEYGPEPQCCDALRLDQSIREPEADNSPKEYHRFDLALSGQGIGANSIAEKALTRTSDLTGGVLFSFRYFPMTHSGFEFNYGHADQTVTVITSGLKSLLETGVHEVTGSYVLRFKAIRSQLTPFLQAGGGMVQFSPKDTPVYSPAVQSQNKPTFLYGAGLEWEAARHLGIRVQYRGLLHAAPSFSGRIQCSTWWSPQLVSHIGFEKVRTRLIANQLGTVVRTLQEVSREKISRITVVDDYHTTRDLTRILQA